MFLTFHLFLWFMWSGCCNTINTLGWIKYSIFLSIWKNRFLIWQVFTVTHISLFRHSVHLTSKTLDTCLRIMKSHLIPYNYKTFCPHLPPLLAQVCNRWMKAGTQCSLSHLWVDVFDFLDDTECNKRQSNLQKLCVPLTVLTTACKHVKWAVNTQRFGLVWFGLVWVRKHLMRSLNVFYVKQWEVHHSLVTLTSAVCVQSFKTWTYCWDQ